jgi:hypothetical protein
MGSSTSLKKKGDVSILSSDQEGLIVARSGKGKVVDRGFKYPKIFVYIPKDVATDTNFPFQIGEDVTVTIDGDKLIIGKKAGKR